LGTSTFGKLELFGFFYQQLPHSSQETNIHETIAANLTTLGRITRPKFGYTRCAGLIG
jgi:hypothetical protein